MLDCCFLPCKGTNFSANYNYLCLWVVGCVVVSYPAKVQIFQLITTSCQYNEQQTCCFLPCKGTNFSANYNTSVSNAISSRVVSYPAKVQIFQLITTSLNPLQKERVVSYPAKVQIFQLITTNARQYATSQPVVSYPAKVQIFQLITTESLLNSLVSCCFLPCKGTNFSANYNGYATLAILAGVVSYPAKVQIFQLITTIS